MIVDPYSKIIDENKIIRNIRFLFPEIKILVLSCEEDNYYAEEAVNEGADGFVAKSREITKIVEAIYASLSD